MKQKQKLKEILKNNFISLTLVIALICIGAVIAGNIIVKEGNMDVSGNLNSSNFSASGAVTAGSLSLTSQPSAKAYLSSQQTVQTATWVKINLDTEVWDTASNYDTTDKKFVAPSAGKYYISVSADWEGTANPGDGERYFLSIKKNGADIEQYYFKTGGAGAFVQKFSTVADLATNDYIEIWAMQEAGDNRTIYQGPKYSYAVIQKLA